jgi:hypothetical protein
MGLRRQLIIPGSVWIGDRLSVTFITPYSLKVAHSGVFFIQGLILIQKKQSQKKVARVLSAEKWMRNFETHHTLFLSLFSHTHSQTQTHTRTRKNNSHTHTHTLTHRLRHIHTSTLFFTTHAHRLRHTHTHKHTLFHTHVHTKKHKHTHIYIYIGNTNSHSFYFVRILIASYFLMPLYIIFFL